MTRCCAARLSRFVPVKHFDNAHSCLSSTRHYACGVTPRQTPVAFHEYGSYDPIRSSIELWVGSCRATFCICPPKLPEVITVSQPHRGSFSMSSHPRKPCSYTSLLFTLLLLSVAVHAQSTGSIEGQITDQNGAIIVSADIRATSVDKRVDRLSRTDGAGRYQFAALPVGDYRLEVRARGFQTLIIESVRVEVARRLTQECRLNVGDLSEQVTVNSTNGVIES